MFFLLESRETIESNITAFNNAGGGNYFLLFKEITVSYDTNQKKQRRERSVLFVFLIVFLNVFFIQFSIVHFIQWFSLYR